MYKATCHCGNVNITVKNLPSVVPAVIVQSVTELGLCGLIISLKK